MNTAATDSPGPGPVHRASPLRAPDFRRLLSARSISFVGDGISQVAVTFAVLQISRSAGAVGVVLAARTVPLIAFMLISGVWADRYSRRTLMVTSDMICLLSQTALAIMLLTGSATIGGAVCLQALYGFGAALFRPASSGMIRDVVPAERLQKANSLLGVSNGISGALGPAVGGAIVAAFSPAFGLLADSASFLLSGILLYSIRASAGRVNTGGGNMFEELRHGWQAFVTRRWVSVSVVYFAVYQLIVLAPLYVLGPVLLSAVPHGAQRWGLLLTCSGFGTIAGGLVAYRFAHTRILIAGYSALFLTVLPLALLAFGAPLVTLAASMVLFGAALSYGATLWNTTLQSNVPADLLGRVSSYDWFGSIILRPVGFALVGPFAVLAGNRGVLFWMSGAGVVATALALLPREIRQARVTAHDDIQV